MGDKSKTKVKGVKEEVTGEEGIKLDGPSDLEMLQALLQVKAQRVDQLEFDNARLTLAIQELGQKFVESTQE